MRIGILSDNHGRLEPVRAALQLFESRAVSAVIHCGDLGGIETLEILSGRPCWFVWGNMDEPDAAWRPWVATLGIHWPEQVPVVLREDNCAIAVCHGHEPVFGSVCRCGDYDFVLHGHTHQKADRRQGRTRILNPGALHRAAVKTVAVLDTEADHVEFCEIGAPHTSPGR
jgi:hypothetical protein